MVAFVYGFTRRGSACLRSFPPSANPLQRPSLTETYNCDPLSATARGANTSPAGISVREGLHE